MTWRQLGAVALAGAAALVAVKCAPVELGDGPRKLTVKAALVEVAHPTLVEATARAIDLGTAVAALADAPDAARLAAAQAAWRSARTPWKHLTPFLGFGPAKELRLGAAIDQFPVDPADLETELAGSQALDGSYVAALGANRKGFHALEWLLFANAGVMTGDPAAALAGFLDAGTGARRRDYVRALAIDLGANLGALRDAWAPDGAFAQSYTQPHTGGSFETIQSSVDALANELVFQTEVVVGARLGKPLGKQSGGELRPAEIESRPSDHAGADIVAALEGIEAAYLGTASGSLSQLVADVSVGADGRIRAAMARALAAARALPRPFEASLSANAAALEAAYQAARDLRTSLATEMIGALGATLKFNDNDGD